MRCIRMEKLRLLLNAEHKQKVRDGITSTFRPDRPWDAVFRRALKDDWFWKRMFEEPALLIRAGIHTMDTFLDGDAKIEIERAPLLPAMPAELLDEAREQLNNRGTKRGADGRPKQQPNPAGVAQVIGTRTQNNAGVKICMAYNQGNCPAVLTGTNLCSSGSGQVHQCSGCGQTGHRYIDNKCRTQKQPAAQGNSRGGPRGNGKAAKRKNKKQGGNYQQQGYQAWSRR